MSMIAEPPDMIDTRPETHKPCGIRDFTFANAVRLSGTANPPSSADVLASA
jgi:hypothetical protein